MGDHLWVRLPYQYVTGLLGQLGLAFLWGRYIEYQFYMAVVKARMSLLPWGK